jgi:pimeloyl-ACP methyl ester carboxylesterase
VRETFIFNAPTWLDEVRDPEVMEIDLGRLRAFTAPALLTMGDQSPPFFRLVVGRIAGALSHASVHTYAGAGHVPHLSHPDEYLRVVGRFIVARLT